MPPSVSVVITSYNRSHLLPRAIESAQCAGKNLEVIVVDDCSSDDTPEVCAQIPDIRYVRLSANPIITTSVGGSPDLLMPDAGILVPPGDSAALAEAMQRLASDPALRKRMGQAARERYLKLFAPDAVLSVLVSTYSRVAGNGHDVSPNGKHPWASSV